MIPAAILGIFSAISTAASLFDQGKKVYETVTGTPSKATTAEQLVEEVSVMPADKLAMWVETMKARVEEFRAETDRLKVEEGEVSVALLNELPPEAAAKVALLRMTTRPIIVLRMSHVILLPVYLFGTDAALSVVNILSKGLGYQVKFELLAPVLLGEGGISNSIYLSLYQAAATPAVIVVLSYMAARLAEKMFGKEGTALAGVNAQGGVASIAGGIAGIGGAIKGIFAGRK